MSSLIGHSLAAIGINLSSKTPSNASFKPSWIAWLILLAIAPDIDHFFRRSLILRYNEAASEHIRITHSILLSLLLPLGTIIVLIILGSKGRSLIQRSLQAILAGLSHLILDLLTGVNVLPLLWPFSSQLFKLPFGLLPSAGKPSLFNYFFYRNLSIELGVLVPLVCISYLFNSSDRHQQLKLAGLLLVSICFMIWSFNLGR